MTGKVFSGRYQINDRIGIGGMAEVYRAQDNVLGRLVAVKVMLPQYAADPDFTRRFRQEAAAAANLQSPYIVNVYDWGQDDGTYYIVMEFVRGSDLKTAIQQRGAVNQRKAAEIGAQVCQALSVAHGQDIIHRDIKPQNIMVQPDGNVKVMDFGIARAKNSMSDKTSSVLGTAHYISPEQAQGKELTAASDIYSLGVVLYEAVTGQLPFDGPDAVGVALKQVKDYPVPPREINPDVDPALEDIIMTALEKDPAHRFATANDMRLALNDFLAGRAVGGRGVAAARNNFTEAQTRVIGPAAGVMAAGDSTQVMPGVNPGANYVPQRNNNFQAPPAKKSKKGPIIAICVVLAVALIAGIAFALGGDKGVAVPNVTKMTQEQAIAELESAGFKVGTINTKYDESVEAGQVISQDPKGGEKREEGTKVNLVISQGTEQVTVPDFYNMTIEQAQAEAKKYNLTLVQGKSENSSDVEADHILSQSPAAGEKVAKGSSITYVMSLGASSVEVPYVTGYSEDSAMSTLKNAGFKVNVEKQYSETQAAGLVISQNPNGGNKVEDGSTITITVSLGPDPAKQPAKPDSSSSSASSSSSSALSSSSAATES